MYDFSAQCRVGNNFSKFSDDLALTYVECRVFLSIAKF